MASNPFRSARFVQSAAEPGQLPADVGAEVAFAGRSNAGKSSALNAICDQGGLARTSKTPGRTQLLNVFAVDDGWRLVDLPGYGYAKVPVAVRDRWQRAIDAYLRWRGSLRGLVLVMDSRHPLKEFDRQMLAYCATAGLPCHVLLTKADKLSRSQGAQALAHVRAAATDAEFPVSVQLFSAHTGAGVDDARRAVAGLLAMEPTPHVSILREN